MKKQNTLNIQILNEDTCRIEAKINPIPAGNSTTFYKPIDVENCQLRSNAYMLTSGSLNLSNTISNLSVQTMRISKTSNILQSNNLINNWGNIPVEISQADDKISLDASLDNPNISTQSIVFLKKPNEKNLLYTPSTICNYYLHSNEVTPCKNDMNKITKLDLNAVSIYDENVTENNECVSSFRNNLNILEDLNGVINKKTPIKYNKSQLRSTEKKKNSASPMETIFEKEASKKELVLNISELDIEDKILSEDLKTPTPNNFIERVNLNFTFNKIIAETPDRDIPVVREEKKIPKREDAVYKINSHSKPSNDMKTIILKNKAKHESLYINTIESKKERSNSYKYPESSYYNTTTHGDRMETSPKATSTKKTTQTSTVKSKSSYSKKSYSGSNSTSKTKKRANEYLNSNNSIKQFLLGMVEKKKGSSITNITNNINIDKIIIQNPILNPEKKSKKSNSIAGDKKKKYKDIASIYSNKSSASSITPIFAKKTVKARSSSKNNDTNKVIEFTINYNQNNTLTNTTINHPHKTPINHTKINNNLIIKKTNPSTSPISTNTKKPNKSIVSAVTPNIKTVYSKPKSAKVITNFSNYTKKSIEMTPSKQIPEIKKQIVSSKIAHVVGDDDDSFDIDDI
jgi:hypothetical protein